MAGNVSGTLRPGRRGGSIHIQTRLYSLTSTMSHVAKMHLSNCLAPKGFAGREMGMGDTDRLPCRPPGFMCHGAIYEETVAPFLESGGSRLFATGAAVQILAVLVHLLQLQDSLPLPPPPCSHPVSRYTSFVKRTKEDTNTIEERFSLALALHGCSDTG